MNISTVPSRYLLSIKTQVLERWLRLKYNLLRGSKTPRREPKKKQR